ncbi:DegV family protein [Acidaminobacter sp. JC074]|uniref:DegV family protein n=1 Tax=Acidaminobacter sp. JC074 TaxID=2530199 RepID=UPI001F10564D|nr:DegV family protein [Acidaminobacter sp. JC074]MCH4888043.1 DegV family protein [Acidaminobacter sp. JC074]
MKTFIVVDSCCDLPLSYVESNKDVLDIIGMPVNIDGFEYYDDLGKTFTHEALYGKLKEGILPSTAQINAYRFAEKFKEHIKDHDTVIYIGFSSGLSGTINNARQGADLVKEEYPHADIRVVDTVSASIGLGVLTVKAVDMVRSGASIDEVESWLEDNKMKANHWFAVDDLHHLKNGGRVSPAEAAVGTLLNIKPILIVNRQGVLKPYAKVKGRKKSIKLLIDKYKEHFSGHAYDKLIIGHGHVEDEAIKLKKQLLEHMEEEQIIISELSATIASHVGPGMLAIAFMGNTREDK